MPLGTGSLKTWGTRWRVEVGVGVELGVKSYVRERVPEGLGGEVGIREWEAELGV